MNHTRLMSRLSRERGRRKLSRLKIFRLVVVRIGISAAQSILREIKLLRVSTREIKGIPGIVSARSVQSDEGKRFDFKVNVIAINELLPFPSCDVYL